MKENKVKMMGFLFCTLLLFPVFGNENKNYLDELKQVKIKELNDSVYSGKNFDELCLIDFSGKQFLLNHNVRNIEGFNFENYEILNKWNNSIKQQLENITIAWNYENGFLLHVETESKKVQTVRGIKVGDSLDKVKETYKDFNPRFYENSVALVFENMIDEELMFLVFYLEDDKVSRIVMGVENWLDI